MTEGTPLTKAALTKAWRTAKLPRLYWRMRHPDWHWDTGEIARFRDGASTTHYYTLDAIREEIEAVRP